MVVPVCVFCGAVLGAPRLATLTVEITKIAINDIASIFFVFDFNTIWQFLPCYILYWYLQEQRRSDYFLLIESVFCTSCILFRNFCLASYSSFTFMIISEAENITSFTSIGALKPSNSLSMSSTFLKTAPPLYLKVVLPSAIFGFGSSGIT